MADILIGLGGTGGKILKAFRQRLWTEFDSSQRKNLPIEFIYVDSDRAMLDASDVSYQTIHGNCVFETASLSISRHTATLMPSSPIPKAIRD